MELSCWWLLYWYNFSPSRPHFMHMKRLGKQFLMRRFKHSGCIVQVLCVLAFAVVYFILIYYSKWVIPGLSYNRDNDIVEWGFGERVSNQLAAKHRPLVFVGGHPRSGTTLMRVLLDSHPSVRCGPETHILPKLLQLYQHVSGPYELTRLKLAGIKKPLLHSVFRNFMLDIIEQHSAKSNARSNTSLLLCNKDPFLLNNADTIKRLFPKSKFIYMIRDGRAVVNSLIERRVTIGSYNLSDFEGCLTKWNSVNEHLVSNVVIYTCRSLSRHSCAAYQIGVSVRFLGPRLSPSILWEIGA